MTPDINKTMQQRDLLFAVRRTGKMLTVGDTPVTALAMISGNTDGRSTDEIGDMPSANIGATLPVISFPVKPVEGNLFTVNSKTSRIASVMLSASGHAWSITGEHVSE